jgi:leucyl aminopeptidase (aminopeptidase T)
VAVGPTLGGRRRKNWRRQRYSGVGFPTPPGDAAAFPDGEQSQMPTEGTARRVVVLNGPIPGLGMPDHRIALHVEAGRVQSIEGNGKVAERLRGMLATYPNADNFAEVGVGPNDGAGLNGRCEEEKKALGTMHVALGDNTSYGGTVSFGMHLDLVLYRPTLAIDACTVLEDGISTF